MFFNELACPSPQPRDRRMVDDAMVTFAHLLRHVARLRADAALVSAIHLPDLELAPGYYLAEWAGQPKHRDLFRAIRSVQNHAPFRKVLPDGVGDGVDYSWNSQRAEALAAAHLLDGLLVSLLLDDCWNVAWVQGQRERLLDNGDGDVVIEPDSVSVRHAATAANAAEHEHWLGTCGLPEPESGADIWGNREELYPHLQFLPQVQHQLDDLVPEWVSPVALELRRLDDAIADWDSATQPLPAWRSKVTREFEMRRQKCGFADLDGVVRTFDWHARFTPGKGRLHFRLVPEQRTARIAYVGPKL
jgi:hypothetical protein